MDKTDYLKLVPGSALEWKAADDGIIYDSNTLYDYIDGGAELYISYGFVNVFSLEYVQEGQPVIHVEIFDMGSSYNAFGVFSNTTETVNSEVGQGGQYMMGSLLFWKDNFFVSIFTDYENNVTKTAMLNIAKHIDEAIPATGQKPGLIQFLTSEYLEQESIIYMIHHAWQNYYHYLSDENTFNISADNDAVLAKYRTNEIASLALLIDYKSEPVAISSIDNIRQTLKDQTDSSNGLIDFGDGMKGMPERAGSKIILVLGENQEVVQKIKQQLINNIKTINYGN